MIGVNLLEGPDIGGLVLNLRDVSERAEAEREKARLQDRLQHAMKMEAVGRLAGGIAHDFNNLLTGIYGSVQMLRMESGDPSKVEHYLGGDQERGRERGLADPPASSLLAYAAHRDEAGGPDALVADLGAMLERLLGEDISVKYSLGQRPGPGSRRSGQFQQVLVNLAANARDAMPEGGFA
jgi:signal transduction histidine kinase